MDILKPMVDILVTWCLLYVTFRLDFLAICSNQIQPQQQVFDMALISLESTLSLITARHIAVVVKLKELKAVEMVLTLTR